MPHGSRACTVVKVGIVFGFDENWLGGINYFRNLLNAVYENPDRQIEIVIFTGSKVDDSRLKGFPPVQVIRSRMLDSASLAWKVRRLLKRLLSRDWLLERLLHRYRISVLSHSGWLGRKSCIRTLGWIPDFQILRMPEFFSKAEVDALAEDFENIARYCTKVVLSSRDARKDLIHFFPYGEDRTAVLNFAVKPTHEDEGLPDRSDLEARYGFHGNYFLLPNQFWAHKNHRIVLEALARLRAQGKSMLVLATGNTRDYRQPNYFDELMAYAVELNVTDCFKVLGIVPLEDLHALMRHALALINPSLFEGWSTTVEEGKSLGKAIILSDIAVHREQNPPYGLFFPADDASVLAEHMTMLWAQGQMPYAEREADIHSRAAIQHRQFGSQYQNLILSLVQ